MYLLASELQEKKKRQQHNGVWMEKGRSVRGHIKKYSNKLPCRREFGDDIGMLPETLRPQITLDREKVTTSTSALRQESRVYSTGLSACRDLIAVVQQQMWRPAHFRK